MCIRVKEGYLMADGEVITFGTKLENIKVEHINQLNEHGTSALEYFLIHSELLEIKTILDELKPHTLGCPVNPVAIRRLIQQEIQSYPKGWWERKSWFVKMVTAIFGLIISAYGILSIAKEFIELTR